MGYDRSVQDRDSYIEDTSNGAWFCRHEIATLEKQLFDMKVMLARDEAVLESLLKSTAVVVSVSANHADPTTALVTIECRLPLKPGDQVTIRLPSPLEPKGS